MDIGPSDLVALALSIAALGVAVAAFVSTKDALQTLSEDFGLQNDDIIELLNRVRALEAKPKKKTRG